MRSSARTRPSRVRGMGPLGARDRPCLPQGGPGAPQQLQERVRVDGRQLPRPDRSVRKQRPHKGFPGWMPPASTCRSLRPQGGGWVVWIVRRWNTTHGQARMQAAGWNIPATCTTWSAYAGGCSETSSTAFPQRYSRRRCDDRASRGGMRYRVWVNDCTGQRAQAGARSAATVTTVARRRQVRRRRRHDRGVRPPDGDSC